MLQSQYPIYIPSKGRADNCITADLLHKYNIHCFIVVEPQDFDAYSVKYKDCVIPLHQNDMGLAYARTFIKKHSEQLGYKYHWQFDDDIKQFQIRENGKNLNVNPLDLICDIEQEVNKYNNVALAGFRDSVFAWTQKTFVSYNKQVSSAFLFMNNNNIYWSSNMIEDTDYSLQVLFAGYCSLIFNTYLYMKKPNNKASGGLSSDKLARYEEIQRNLVNKYPNVLKLMTDKKTGKVKVASSRVWLSFHQVPIYAK